MAAFGWRWYSVVIGSARLASRWGLVSGPLGSGGSDGRWGCSAGCLWPSLADGCRVACGWVGLAGGGFCYWRGAPGGLGCLVALLPLSFSFRSGALLSVFPALVASVVVVGGEVVNEVQKCGCMGTDVFFSEAKEGIGYRPYPVGSDVPPLFLQRPHHQDAHAVAVDIVSPGSSCTT